LVNKGQRWLNLGAVAAVIVAFALIFVKNAPGNTNNQLLNVSYDPTRELYTDLDAQFVAAYEKQTGKQIAVVQSHGGSSRQSRKVISGEEPADVVTLALFTDVGDEKNCAARLESGFVDGAGDRDEAGEAGAIVGDAGRVEAIAVAADFNFGAGRKNGVEVSGEHYDFFVVGAGEFADHIAGFVDRDFEAAVGEKRFHEFSAGGFLKGRRGNFGDTDLLVIDPAEIA